MPADDTAERRNGGMVAVAHLEDELRAAGENIHSYAPAHYRDRPLTHEIIESRELALLANAALTMLRYHEIVREAGLVHVDIAQAELLRDVALRAGGTVNVDPINTGADVIDLPTPREHELTDHGRFLQRWHTGQTGWRP